METDKHFNTDFLAYKSWESMKNRCTNPNSKDFKRYGHLTIDSRWEVFEEFLKDMGERPSLAYSIDRTDPTQGYNRENCRWVLKIENSRRATWKYKTEEDRQAARRESRKKWLEKNPEYRKRYYKRKGT